MADIQNFVGFAQDERLIKEYFGFKMYAPVRARINLSVTNRRVIVYSSVKSFFTEDQPSLFQQIAISEIRGIEALQATRYNTGLLVASVAALALGGALAFAGSVISSLASLGSTGGIAGGVILVLGIVGILVVAFRPKRIFRFTIRGQAIDLSIGEFEKVSPVIAGGTDLQGIVEELGALVIQIQDGTA